MEDTKLLSFEEFWKLLEQDQVPEEERSDRVMSFLKEHSRQYSKRNLSSQNFTNKKGLRSLYDELHSSLLDLEGNEMFKSAAKQSFFENFPKDNINPLDLFEILRNSNIEKSYKLTLIKKYLQDPKNIIGAESLRDVIENTGIDNKLDISDLIQFFLETPHNRNKKMSLPGLVFFLQEGGIEDKSYRFAIIQSFFQDNNMTLDNLFDILEVAKLTEKSNQFAVIKSFFAINKMTSLNDLKYVLGRAKSTQEFNRSAIIQSFFEDKNVLELEGFLLILKGEKFTEKSNQSAVIKSFFINYNQKDLYGDLSYTLMNYEVEALDLIDILRRARGNKLENFSAISFFLDSSYDRNKKINISDLVLFLKEGGIVDEFFKNSLIKSIFDKDSYYDKITATDLADVLEAAKFISPESDNLNKNYNFKIIELFLNNYKNPNNKVNLEDLTKILLAINEDGYTKFHILKSFFGNPNNKVNLEDITKILLITKEDNEALDVFHLMLNAKDQDQVTTFDVKDFIKFVKENDDLKYELTPIIFLYMLTTKHREDDILIASELQLISKELYPNNEFIQIDFLKEAVNQIFINEENFSGVNLSEIKNDELLLDFIQYLKTEAIQTINIPEQDLIKLVKNKTDSKYKSLSDLFLQKELKDCLSEKGMKTIQDLFGKEYVQEEKLTASDLLNYYSLKDKMSEFREILNTNVLVEIKEKFHPSKDVILFGPKEIKKLSQLFHVEKKEIEKSFFKTSDLCEYFKHKVKITPLAENEKEDFEIIFLKDSSFMTDQKISLNKKFRDILLDPNNNVKVVDFFKLMLAEGEENVINKNNENKIIKVWEESKDLISTIFKREGGIENITSSLFTINDGCFANIGTQLNTIIYGALLEKEWDTILYMVLIEKIINPILNTYGEDRIGIEKNPLKNKDVNEYLLSPDGLEKALMELFWKDNKVGVMKSWDFIEKIIGLELRTGIAEEIDYNEVLAAKSISRFALEKVLGEDKVLEKFGKISELEMKIIDPLRKNVKKKMDIENQMKQSPEKSPNPINSEKLIVEDLNRSLS